VSTVAERSTEAIVRQARRDALGHHPTQIGIDFVAADAGQRRLTVFFVPPAPGVVKTTTLSAITTRNVRLGDQNGLPANLRVADVLAGEGGNSLLIDYAPIGESRSALPLYVLELVDLPVVDPFFARAAFSLTSNAPADFDPAPAAPPPAALPPDAEIDYLARDYASFRRLMLDRLSLRMPRWTERNPADLGVAVVEVLAYAADQLSYYQDAVATEAYLGTARQRTSVRRHAALLDYAVHEGNNARVWVQVGLAADADRVELPRGTPLLTRSGPEPRVAPGSSQLARLVADGAQWFETLHSAVLFAAHDLLPIHTWGAQDYGLPAGAVTATLRDAFLDPADPSQGRKLDRLQAGHVLIVEEMRGPLSGEPVDADPEHRHAVRLTRVARGTDPLGGGEGAPAEVPVVAIEWAAADALPFALTVSASRGRGVIAEISAFRGNVVLADFGRSLGGEMLPEVPAEGPYRPELQRGPVTWAVPYDEVAATAQPAAAALRQDPRSTVPQILLAEQGTGAAGASAEWRPVARLLQSDRFAREFVVETENDGRATLRFGDGTRGRQPRAGSVFEARYRIGNGVAGNVGGGAIAHVVSGAIAHVVSGDPAIAGVHNPLPATGGTEPEPLEQVRQQAPWAFKTQERCVTAEDYRAIARRHPEVREAAATLRWTGSWTTAFVAVVRRGMAPADEAFRREVAAFLAPYQPAGLDLEVRGPRYVPLDVLLRVEVGPEHFRSTVLQRLREVFSAAELPGDGRGFFHPDNFSFGQAVYSSPIIAAAMRIPGVARADMVRFQRWGLPAAGELEAGRIRVGPLEIAQVASDATAPDNGQIAFTMEGGR
jgi:hypothetical protein